VKDRGTKNIKKFFKKNLFRKPKSLGRSHVPPWGKRDFHRGKPTVARGREKRKAT